MSKFSAVFGGEDELTAFHDALEAIAGSAEVEQRQNVGIGLALLRRKTKLQDPLTKQLLRVAQVDHIKRHTRETANSEQLEELWQMLQSHSTVQLDNKQFGITYSKFLECGTAAFQAFDLQFDAYFRPLVFYGLHRFPPQNAVAINQVFNLVIQGAANERHRISLVPYDSSHNGTLSEDDLKSWLHDKVPNLRHLSQMSDSFLPTYAIYAATKFFFHLDRTRTRKIKILDLLSSVSFAELMELQHDGFSEDMPPTNWFSIPFVTHVHTQFLELDKDNDGMLSFAELCNLDNRSISPVFVSRLLQEYTTFDGMADYRLYLVLVLARLLPDSEESIRFYFRVLDVDHQGYLTTTTLLYFWRGMDQHPKMDVDALEPNFFENIKNEIFDMVRPKDPFKITLADLLASQRGAYVTQILTDVDGFARYENRESG